MLFLFRLLIYVLRLSTAFIADDAEELGGSSHNPLYRWDDMDLMVEDGGEFLEAIAQRIRDRNRAKAPRRVVEETLGAPPTMQDAGIWRVRVKVCSLDLVPVSYSHLL